MSQIGMNTTMSFICKDHHKYNNVIYMRFAAHNAQVAPKNLAEVLFIKSIVLRLHAERKMIDVQVSILLQPKANILKVTWDCSLGRFWCISNEVYVQVLLTVMSMSQHALLFFLHILCGLGTLLGDCFSNTFATLIMFSRGWFICLGLSEIRVYICVSQAFNTCSLGFP